MSVEVLPQHSCVVEVLPHTTWSENELRNVEVLPQLHMPQMWLITVEVVTPWSSNFSENPSQSFAFLSTDPAKCHFNCKKWIGNAKCTQKLYANITSSCAIHENLYSGDLLNADNQIFLKKLLSIWGVSQIPSDLLKCKVHSFLMWNVKTPFSKLKSFPLHGSASPR